MMLENWQIALWVGLVLKNNTKQNKKNPLRSTISLCLGPFTFEQNILSTFRIKVVCHAYLYSHYWMEYLSLTRCSGKRKHRYMCENAPFPHYHRFPPKQALRGGWAEHIKSLYWRPRLNFIMSYAWLISSDHSYFFRSKASSCFFTLYEIASFHGLSKWIIPTDSPCLHWCRWWFSFQQEYYRLLCKPFKEKSQGFPCITVCMCMLYTYTFLTFIRKR